MPPRKKPSQTVQQSSVHLEESADIPMSHTTLPSSSIFEDILDNRLKVQMKELNDVLLKYHKATQEELKAIQSSQDFIGKKFDDPYQTWGYGTYMAQLWKKYGLNYGLFMG